MKKNNISNGIGLQAYMVKRIAKHHCVEERSPDRDGMKY